MNGIIQISSEFKKEILLMRKTGYFPLRTDQCDVSGGLLLVLGSQYAL